MDSYALTSAVKNKAREIGFDTVGIAPAGAFPESQFYKEWLARGFAADMKYMEREPQRREEVRNIMPEAVSVISCAMNYNAPLPYSTQSQSALKGWISRYAWGEDYHEILEAKLKELAAFIKGLARREVKSRVYVDTGPVLERVYAKHAGLGWIGKNTCLINQKIGSWTLLGEIICDIELEYDSPAAARCGSCTRCIDACPTGALTKPYELDSRLCISYLTIENKGQIPAALREGVGRNVYGCDICQDVCPWNKRATTSDNPSFQPREGLFHPDLSALAALSDEDFRRIFKSSPVKRAKRRGFIRNVLVAMGNSGEGEFIPQIIALLGDAEPLVRMHAAWALWKIQGSDCREALASHLGGEEDSGVRGEMESLLARIQSGD
ncbi:MAG: tRNA epoxyqueuosine(34) reductase QueG [Deltaproteobacteria bacterium]